MAFVPAPSRSYFDNNATTPATRFPQVLNSMANVFRYAYGNPSASYAEGVAARNALSEARALVALCLGVPADALYFTGGGTDSNNILVRDVMGRQAREHGRDIIVTSAVEHSSVRITAARCGYRHIEVPVDGKGRVLRQEYERILAQHGPRIGLVSIIYAQNEVGTLQPIRDLALRARQLLGTGADGVALVPFHTDATQAMGKYVLNPRTLGVDAMTGSAHKFNGPRGVGILYAGADVLDAVYTPQTGGGQERGIRCGTENVPAIVGAAAALRESLGPPNTRAERAQYVRRLRDYIRDSLRARVPDMVVNGDEVDGLYNTLSVAFPGCHGPTLATELDARGFAVGSGSACNRAAPSKVLAAMRVPEAVLHGTVRISLSGETTQDECAHLVSAISGALPACRARDAERFPPR